MKNTFSEFIAAYQKAPQTIQQIIDSEIIGVFVDSLITDNLALEPHKRPLMVITSNRLLNIIPETSVTTLLQEFITDSQVSSKISTLIQGFVRSKIDGVIVNTVTTINTTPSQEIQPNTTKSSAQNSVPHVRTMADDMTKSQVTGEKVYTSTQEAILREGWSTPKQTPSPTTPQTPTNTSPVPPVSTENWG
jgi:hypothetical protein